MKTEITLSVEDVTTALGVLRTLLRLSDSLVQDEDVAESIERVIEALSEADRIVIE